MKIDTVIKTLALCAVIAPLTMIAQPGTTAIPGLSLTTSTHGNGMGGAAATIPLSDPAATIANPAQLGLFSLDNLFSVSTYSPKTEWLPVYAFDPSAGPTITVSALNAGINLTDLLSLPFSAGIGIGYSRTFFDLGTFYLTGSNSPQVIASASMNDTYINYSVGLGFECIARLGVGMNFKKITSRMPTFGFGSYESIATPSATDFGILLDIPITDIVARASAKSLAIAKGIEPFLDISTAYVKSNVGDEVKYADFLQSDPLPRTAVIGLGLEGGLTARAGKENWRMVSFALVHQAEDLLVKRHNDGTFEYAGGLGDLMIGDNVLIGRVTGYVLVRKGWELGAAEFLYIRGGSVIGNGYDYSTSGYSVCFGGLVRFLEFASPEIAGTPWLAFIGDHIDLRYQSASYSSPVSSVDGTTFRELNFIFRGFPW